MFYRLAILGLKAVSGIVQLLPEDDQPVLFERVVGETTNPQSSSHSGAVQFLFADGSVRYGSLATGLRRYRVSGVPVLDAFWTEVAQELNLGALREDWKSLPGVSELPTAFEGPVLFSYDGLAAATKLLVDPPVLERRLVRSLRLAEAAERRGREADQDRFMERYSRDIQDGSSNTFLIGERIALLDLARALKDSTTPVP